MSKALVWREVDEMGVVHSYDMVVSDECFELFDEADIYAVDDAVDALLNNIDEHEAAYQELEDEFESVFKTSLDCALGDEDEMVSQFDRLTAGMAYHENARSGLLADLDSLLEVSGYYGYSEDEETTQERQEAVASFIEEYSEMHRL